MALNNYTMYLTILIPPKPILTHVLIKFFEYMTYSVKKIKLSSDSSKAKF